MQARFIVEKISRMTCLNSVGDSKPYLVQYSGQAELNRRPEEKEEEGVCRVCTSS
jgi:hypothetical protein